MLLYSNQYIPLLVAKERRAARPFSHKSTPILTKFFMNKLHKPIPVAGLHGCATFRLLGLRVRPSLGYGSVSLLIVACCRVEL